MKLLDNDYFWDVISHIDWEGCGYDIDEAKRRMLSKVRPPQSIDFIKGSVDITYDEFKNIFEEIVSLINDETSRRVDSDERSFGDGFGGGDDCHFMDMPAHLIGLGRQAVENYLNGGLVEHEVVECLSYIFHD